MPGVGDGHYVDVVRDRWIVGRSRALEREGRPALEYYLRRGPRSAVVTFVCLDLGRSEGEFDQAARLHLDELSQSERLEPRLVIELFSS